MLFKKGNKKVQKHLLNSFLDPRLYKNGLGIVLSNIVYKLQLFQIIYEF